MKCWLKGAIIGLIFQVLLFKVFLCRCLPASGDFCSPLDVLSNLPLGFIKDPVLSITLNILLFAVVGALAGEAYYRIKKKC